MMHKILLGFMPAMMLFVAGSNVWADDAEIDCSTASNDIATLEGEKKKVKEKKSKSLFSITPIGMIAGAVSNDGKEDDSGDMHVDEYNEKIDAHIAKIKAACGDGAAGDSE